MAALQPYSNPSVAVLGISQQVQPESLPQKVRKFSFQFTLRLDRSSDGCVLRHFKRVRVKKATLCPIRRVPVRLLLHKELYARVSTVLPALFEEVMPLASLSSKLVAASS
jgi:hypothetical protein